MTVFAQGEVWDIAFADGYERPGIVVSRGELNRGRLLLVIPCTSSRVAERCRFDNNVLLEAGVGGLTVDTVAQAHLIQPVDAEYLLRKRGDLDEETLGEILHAVAWVLDLYGGE